MFNSCHVFPSNFIVLNQWEILHYNSLTLQSSKEGEFSTFFIMYHAINV